MNNIHSSIDSPHPDLQVDEKANELAPYLPASNNGTLLYQGPVVGRWPNAEIAYSHAPGLSDEERHARAASFSTGIDGSGDVRFKLSPDPHISWWFCTHDWSVGGSWPVLVPPERPASGFATYDGVRGVVPLRLDRYTTGGSSRVMFPVRIGDRNGRLDEVKFYLVNFQVWHLVDDVYHKEQLERKARLSLRADVWRIDIERRLDFPQALNHLEEQRGYAVTHNCRLWKETDDGERQQFTFEEAEPLLEATRLFASLR